MKSTAKLLVLATLIFSALFLTGCADSLSFEEAAKATPVGFWYGLWHGLIFPFAFIISLIEPHTAVYAINNNGGWYDFGFFLGIGGFSATALSSKKKRR